MAILIKVVFTVLAVGLWLMTQKYLGSRNPSKGNRIHDHLHILTKNINDYLYKSTRAANGLLISSSLIVDILGISLLLQSILGTSIRPLVALIILFTLRQLNQAITVLPTPGGMIWRNPGVPSLFVTYGVSNDLFFSGHTALAVLGALEMVSWGGEVFVMLGIMVVVFEVMTVIVLRAHWTMDVFTGVITALWVHDLSVKISPYLDRFVATLG